MHDSSEKKYTVGQFLGGSLGQEWESRRAQLDALLLPLGLDGHEFHQSLYILPCTVESPAAKIESLRVATAKDGHWAVSTLTGENGARAVVALPVAADYKINS